MAKKSLAEIQAAFTSKTSNENSNSVDWKRFYQFWKMQVDQTAVVRFLPDLSDENPLGFLVENLTHELLIAGKKKIVPCLSMFGEHCPICEASRKFYAEEGDTSVNGKKYYRKKNYIGQILVVESPIEHDQEQLVKLIEFGPKIFKIIQAAFKSGDLENLPYDFKGGYNFRIKKTQNGNYADYSTSSFAPKATDVSDDVMDSIELNDLTTFRGKPIAAETLQAMLDASLNGTAYGENESKAPDSSDAHVESDVADSPAPSAPASTDTGTPAGNQDYLAVIRARAAAKKAAAAAASTGE